MLGPTRVGPLRTLYTCITRNRPSCHLSLAYPASHLPCSVFYSTAPPEELVIEKQTYPRDEWTNVPQTILECLPRKLHLEPNHPIAITRRLIASCFPDYQHHNNLTPVVSVDQNFDVLGFPPDHPGRSRTDTYYINKKTVLRTHTSAHQADIFRANTSNGFTVSADVYRRDAVDRSHYPVFHQMEAAMTWDRDAVPATKTFAQMIWDDVARLPSHDLTVEDPNATTHPERNPIQTCHEPDEVEAMTAHLKRSIELVVQTIFSSASQSTKTTSAEATSSSTPLRVRWIEAYFPFTSPSWELEIYWQDAWLEVLGCGIISQPLLDAATVPSRAGWALGIGLERLAMLLYEIPDIRLFWSRDPRFLSQFRADGRIARYVPFSKYPAATRDVAFWLPRSPSAAGGHALASSTSLPFHENDMMELFREVCADTVEDVRLVDEFLARNGQKSLCYRIVYRSLERTLTKPEVAAMHAEIREKLVQRFGVELR